MMSAGVSSPDDKRFLRDEAFRGWELVGTTARLCQMNLLLHGIGALEAQSPITVGDALETTPAEHFDIVLTNPPFGRTSTYKFVNADGRSVREHENYPREDFWVDTTDKPLNFVQHVKSLLTRNGRAAVVVPDNLLFTGGAEEAVRRRLLEECDVHTLLRLPTGIFYASGVKANVLFFDRQPASGKAGTEKLWIYDLRTGQRFTPKTRSIVRADLDDFVACYNPANRHDRIETERFHAFTYDELISREKASLDIFWLGDADHRPDNEMQSMAFEHAASGDLDSYVREFVADSPELTAAVNAGRLPFTPTIAKQFPDRARLAARIWAVTSAHSPTRRQILASIFHAAELSV
jgi:type I restriction enzyme M protein